MAHSSGENAGCGLDETLKALLRVLKATHAVEHLLRRAALREVGETLEFLIDLRKATLGPLRLRHPLIPEALHLRMELSDVVDGDGRTFAEVREERLGAAGSISEEADAA